MLSSPRISFFVLFIKYSEFLEGWIICFPWFQNIFLLWCGRPKAWIALGLSHNLFSYNLFLRKNNVIIRKPVANQFLQG